MFLNRTRELGYLNARYQTSRAEIVVLYGRRRVGKSALLFEWVQGKPHVFFFARRADKSTLLAEFSQEIQTLATGKLAPSTFTYPSWAAAFQAIAELSAQRRVIVVLDEFPYLVQADPELPTLIQREWDLRLQHTQVFLVLTGSLQSVIRQQILDPAAPLYRRHTWPFELKPLTLTDLPAFFPRYAPPQLVETYAVLGGMPYYLISVDPQASLLTNIKRHILSPQGSLFAEIRLQLHEELRGNIENSMAILRAIAAGNHRRAEIARLAGLPTRSTDHHLATLVELGILDYRHAVDRIRRTDRWGSYHIRDPFFRFWHQWVLPHEDYLAIGRRQEEVADQIRQAMPRIVAPVWEEIARQHLLVASAQGRVAMRFEEIGSWWSGEAQIDVVGVNRAERRVLFGEAKWTREPLAEGELDALLDRGTRWLDGDTGWDVQYALFAREMGQVRERVGQEPGFYFFTPADIVEGK
ncbi:MAG: helix-turn-helix domain-containing protein [Chloroflexi bacterium]|nr:helix-turn-helix domain-containing protein [Chloroflexota bacterium]